jgi:ribosome-associated heat shock protein Hsp15
MAIELERLRLDKWLWAARFFKTRALAVTAIKGGKVHVNKQRVKPARAVQVGDQLDISRNQVHFTVDILGLNDKRRPAKEAQLLYLETTESQQLRTEQAEQRRLVFSATSYEKRPDKKQRRQIHRLKRREQ